MTRLSKADLKRLGVGDDLLQSEPKYHNEPVVVDGYRFDSQKEARRFAELRLMQMVGYIKDLEWRKKWLRIPLRVNDDLVCVYVPDFTYIERGDDGKWHRIVEDCKGVRTPIYRLKCKLMKAIHGIEIRET